MTVKRLLYNKKENEITIATFEKQKIIDFLKDNNIEYRLPYDNTGINGLSYNIICECDNEENARSLYNYLVLKFLSFDCD